jgi:hypothetical protein
MPHYPQKKQRIEGHPSAMVAGNDFSPSFGDLADVLPNILGYLTLKEIMCKRRINKKTMEAVRRQLFHHMTSVFIAWMNTMEW